MANNTYRADFIHDNLLIHINIIHQGEQKGTFDFVCSGLEAGAVKARFGKSFVTMVPGIRPAWSGLEDDQKRVVAPAAAVQNGADYLVIGCPIRDSDDPAAAADSYN